MCARHRMFIAIAVCAIGLGRGTLPAEAAPSAEPLRVDALVTEALKQNPEIEAARQRWRAAQERVPRSEEHTSELQSQSNLVCRLLLEKKKYIDKKKKSDWLAQTPK